MSGAGGTGGTGGAALRAAAAAGDHAECARILGAVRSVRFSRDELGRSAFHLAASAGHTNVIRLLINVSAPRESDSPDGAGCTPLQRAAADGHDSIVRLLLTRGADVDRPDSVHRNCALHEAAWKGYSRTVALLAGAGAALDRPNGGGFTPLHLCCQNGHNQSCRELLLAGCHVDLQNNYGDTALHTAARYGHAGVTRILISAQCRISEQNKNGDTALHIAAAMGRRKLTRILLEAGCDSNIRNKQAETARDIALRKGLVEVLTILDQPNIRKEKKKLKKKGKNKVRFDKSTATVVTPNTSGPQHWSPYGCHYYPDPEAFPSPRLETLPDEPLQRGEQYYLDLAGRIRKGPVGVGYTCYCAPLFRHLEARLEKDKKELQRAQIRLGQRVAGLEQRISRGGFGRRSERLIAKEKESSTLTRSKSLEVLEECIVESALPLPSTRSMDELDQDESRPSVKELVARIQQQQQPDQEFERNQSESSDEDTPLRMVQHQGPMGNSNLYTPPPPDTNSNPNYENVPSGPRSRAPVYSPAHISPALETNERFYPSTRLPYSNVSSPVEYTESAPRYNDVNTRFAKLRLLDGRSVQTPSTSKIFESTARMLEHPNDIIDRDTNNDSGYSTKVYGSSKGNSPSLSGPDNECLGASSLV